MTGRRHVVLLSACLLPLWWCGCSEDPSSQIPGPTSVRGDVAGVGFDVPAGWIARPEEEPDSVTLVTDDTHGSLGPLVLVKVVIDPIDRTVQKTIDDLADAASSIREFKLMRKELVDHERGFEYGRVEYTQSDSGMPMVEAFVVVRLPDRRRLIVSGVALKKRGWPKCEPVFAGVVKSLELPSGAR